MGSGFSTCNGPATVAVRSSISRHEQEGLALSDSHDSGISEVGRGRPGGVDARELERHFFESNQEGPGTPRSLYGSGSRHRPEMAPTDHGNNYRLHLRRNHSLSEFAITEEDEESTPTRTRMVRPKSANVRKRRGLKSGRRRSGTEKSRKTESTGGLSSDATDSDLDSEDSDVLSIPDETGPFRLNDDWWRLDSSVTRDPRDYGSFSVRSVHDVNIAKKASERSISSIILFDPVSTNSDWCVFTNPDAANIIRKNITELEEELWTGVKAASEDCRGEIGDFVQLVRRYRSSFTRLVLEYRQASEPASSWNRDPDEEKLKAYEEQFAEGLYYRQATLTRQELSTFLAEHLQRIEGQLEAEVCGASHLGDSGSDVMGANDLLSSSEVDSRWAKGTAPKLREVPNIEQLTDALSLVLTRNRVGVTLDDLLPVIRSHHPRVNALDVRDPNLELAKTLVERSRHGGVSREELQSAIDVHLSESPAGPRRAVSSAKPGIQIGGHVDLHMDLTSERSSMRSSRPSTVKSQASTSLIQTKLVEMDVKQRLRPDSGVVVTSSSSGSYSSSERSRDNDVDTASLDSSWISASLQLLDGILRVRTEQHDSLKSLVAAITRDCETPHTKAHALYRWLASQSLEYYSKASHKPNSPTGKMKQLAEKKITYASLYQEMIRCVGLKCELVEGVAKHRDYLPGDPVTVEACRHVWNAVLLDGQYRLMDVQFGAQPFKYFVEHFFLAPPDEFKLSHLPNNRKWSQMSQTTTIEDFEGTLKTWPAMFAFNIRPLSMKAVMRTYDGKLSVTVLLQNVAVTPTLQYLGPGPAQDSESLLYYIDQEIRSVDNAETFHLNLPKEGTYYFTLLVHDVEEDADIPALQYRIDYTDELL
ncbi:uncharacterized protein LOC124133785 isoform X1 [Haliotis rufescens]|uniref:uncharacterized protein LOC124133785 isoform X1 n=1 Tax=Haliotis rufescens TaxID=6454 RepID=UPI001EAFEB73|nr:uncharacterized protein LOC124133785 isoform X1 [Haliotis rufescens]XP_046354276.1 uncharacterized protein LOC124133785 isoform X1 [Haliotis rufescens]